jgi:hypothetical protein
MKSKLFFAIGACIFATACLGQRPPDEKPVIHFITDIIKVDSIISASYCSDLKRVLHILPIISGPEKEIEHFELCRERNDRKRTSE